MLPAANNRICRTVGLTSKRINATDSTPTQRGHLAIQVFGWLAIENSGNCRFWPIHVELIPETGWHLYAL